MNECLKHLAQKEKLLEENYALQMKPDVQHNKIFQRNQSMANCNNRREKFLVFHLFACELLDY